MKMKMTMSLSLSLPSIASSSHSWFSATSTTLSSLYLRAWHLLATFVVFMLAQPGFRVMLAVTTVTAIALSPEVTALPASPPMLRTSLAAQSDLAALLQSRQHRDAGSMVTGMTPGQAVIAAVPEEERGSFLLYQLAQALKGSTNNDNSNNNSNKDISNNGTSAVSYQKPRFPINVNVAAAIVSPRKVDMNDDFKDVPIYDSFHMDLLAWVKRYFDCTDLDVYNFIYNKSMLCTANGVCYNQDDIGCYCCPF